ncbi:MAG: peptidylprolyl isomerase [Acidiferrobacterales bacterium]
MHKLRRTLSLLIYDRLRRLARPALLVLAFVSTAAPCLGAVQAPAAPASTPAVSEIDRILVVVNDDVITESELDSQMKDVERRIAAQKLQAPPENVLRKQVLERLIIEHLQLQIAKQLDIKVSDARVDKALQTIAQQNHTSLPALYKTLGTEGIEPVRFRQQIHNQLIIQQLLDREINDRVTVSQSEVDNFMANKANRDGGTEYNISHILIAIPDSASPEVIQKAHRKAEDLLKELRGGENFEQLAIANSQGEKALEGGNLGWKKSGQLPQLFVDALIKMKPGDISDVLRSSNGFHILKLNARRGGGNTQTVTQTHVRHILIRTNELVTPQDARNRLEQLRARIENGEDFAALARANSEDPGSRSNGGDLGWVSPGQMVPQFEKAMDALKINEISAPVQTPYGFHLIQVLGRRVKDVTSERNEASAREQIHERKADERYEQWVRQLRDEAYVDYLDKNLE